MEQARVAAEGVLPLHVLWCAWVLLCWTVTRPARPADTAHCFARVRDHYQAGSLAAVPAERDRKPSRNSSRDRIDLSVNAGEVHSIMGPNGSGKSRLAQVLARRENYDVTEGQILYDGKDLLENEA